jgi:hypothetical protein
MQVPDSGSFEWHVNQSARPLNPGETWTLTCERTEGTAAASRQIAIARGEVRNLGDACAQTATTGGGRGDSVEPPRGDIDVVGPPGVKARVGATFNGRTYRARVAGSLVDPKYAPGGERCAGRITLTITAGGGRVITGRANLDAGCGFAKTFRFTKRKLPRRLRNRGARLRLRAVTTWPGNEFIEEIRHAVSAPVKRR